MCFDIETRENEGATYVAVTGELDVATAPLLAERIAQAETAAAPLIVVDLSGVSFMDSTGLHTLLEAHARSQQEGDRLRIASPWSAQVQRLMELAGVVDELPLLPVSAGS